MMDELAGATGKPRIVATIFDNALATIIAFVVAAKVPWFEATGRTVIVVVVYLAYYFVPEAIWSRTLVKSIVGLVVRRTNGELAGWREAAIRTLLRFVEANPLLLGVLPGVIVVMRSRRKQRLRDMLAGTVVVSSR